MRMSRGTLFDLAMDCGVAAMSTGTTLWHRLPMFGIVSVTSAVERQAEATRMVDEKAAAFIEGYVAVNLELARIWNAVTSGELAAMLNAPLAITNAGLKPAFRRVNANAHRLNRRATRSLDE